MADGSVLIDVKLDISKADRQLAKLKDSIDETKASVEQKTVEKSAIEKELESATLAANKTRDSIAQAKDALKEAQAAMDKNTTAGFDTPLDDFQMYLDNIKAIPPEIEKQEEEYEKQIKTIEKLTAKLSAVDGEIEKGTALITKQSDEAACLEQNIAMAGSPSARIKEALAGAGDSVDHFARRTKELMKSALIFSVITKAFTALRERIWESIQANDQARAAVARLQGALLTLAQPILNVVIPAFTWLVDLLAKVVTAIARVVSLLFGTSIAKSAAQATKSLFGEAGALSDVGAAAKEAAGSLAGFDEINTIDTSTSGGGGGGGGGGGNGLGGSIAPDFTSLIDSSLDAIVELFSGIALLALGAILAFSGASIPLGIGLMAIGAALIADAAATNWEALQQVLQGSVGGVVAILSGAVLALGALLAFSGVSIPIGLALMAAGAVGLVTAAAANWGGITQLMAGPIGVITAMISGALLAVGLVLALSGINIPLGLAMMAVGAAGLYASRNADWSAVIGFVHDNINAIVDIVSTALLAIGVLLVFSTVNIPLGLGLIAAAAAGLAVEAVVNWDAIVGYFQGPLGILFGILSGSLLVLGAILAFSAANIPLGLGMMAVAAAGLAATVTANWDYIVSALQGPLGQVVGLVGGYLLVLGIVLLFSGAGIPLGLGLMAIGAAGLAAAIVPNWGWLLQKLSETWNSIKNWWNSNVAKYLTLNYWTALGRSMMDGLVQGLKSAFTAFVQFWRDVWQEVKQIASDAWDWIWGKISGVINSMLGGIEGFLNAFVNAFNSIFGFLNNFKVEIPDWVPKIGGGVLGFNIPLLDSVRLPRLAQGAVIPPNREFMAVLGDQKTGNNIEAPESLIRQIVREESGGGSEQILREILSAIKEGKVLVVDRKELGRVAARGINELIAASGKSILKV